MPAYTEAALFDYETAIEDALTTALGTLLTGVQILNPRSPQSVEAKKTTPRIELALTVASSPEHHNLDRAGVEYRDSRTGSISFLCAARREITAQSLGLLRGTIRANLRKSKTILNPTNLPNYEVFWLEESGAVPQFEAENDEIHCIITADIEWQIKPDAYPIIP